MQAAIYRYDFFSPAYTVIEAVAIAYESRGSKVYS